MKDDKDWKKKKKEERNKIKDKIKSSEKGGKMKRKQLDRERRGLSRSEDRSMEGKEGKKQVIRILQTAEAKGYRGNARARLMSVGHGGYQVLKKKQRKCERVKKSVDRSCMYKDFKVSVSKVKSTPLAQGGKERKEGKGASGSERVRLWVDGVRSDVGHAQEVAKVAKRRIARKGKERTTMKVHAMGLSDQVEIAGKTVNSLKWYDRGSAEVETLESDYQGLMGGQKAVENVRARVLAKVCQSLNRKSYRSMNRKAVANPGQNVQVLMQGRVEKKKGE